MKYWISPLPQFIIVLDDVVMAFGLRLIAILLMVGLYLIQSRSDPKIQLSPSSQELDQNLFMMAITSWIRISSYPTQIS
jgi:hypothetical protein